MARSLTRLILTLVIANTCATACATAELPPSAPESAPLSENALKRLDAKSDHRWIYDGLLPPLDSWSAVLSLAGHTVRVTGRLPAGWDAPLPRWAYPSPTSDGGVEVTVVYPIATARLADGWGRETGSKNATPGDYRYVSAYPFTPSDPTTGVPWGGFPFLEYDLDRHLAFHGPITAENGSWRLLRGPVSHGCARMQGEHVVEFAHMVGLDMGSPDATARGLPAPAGGYRVRVVEDFDRLPDGRRVDVDYPGAGGFSRPTGPDVFVFETWSTDDFPRFVCAHDPTRSLGDGHCDALPEMGKNPVRARDLGQIVCPTDYVPMGVGKEGGVLCTSGRDAWGPFTRAMVEQCRAWGGGAGCTTERWSLSLARRARGEGVCPLGATLDARDTGYCVEGEDAFGPFPPAYVEACKVAGGGRACTSARWRVDLLRGVIARAGRITAAGEVKP
jgi:hypothetical protein